MKIHEMSIQDQINFWQRYIIVHSKLYYFMDTNIISDKKYDETCLMLVKMKETYPEEWKNSEYFLQFGEEYVGNTGFDLFEGLTKHQIAIIDSIIYHIHQSRGMDMSHWKKRKRKK